MALLIAYCCTYLMKIKLPLTICLKIAKVFPARKKQANKQTERQTKKELCQSQCCVTTLKTAV